MDALGIDTAILAGFDWGARSADVVAALWPGRCRALVPVSGYLIGSQAASHAPLPPQAELAWWYQFYFATDRGQAGYEKYRREFSNLIWRLASPKWVFDDATFARSAAAFDNPDHVAVVIDNYRWRLGLAVGESQYDDLEQRLAGFPAITVPTITLEGDASGAPHPDATTYASKFTGKYEHRVVEGGIGHNLPQEAPQAFAEAIIDAGRRLPVKNHAADGLTTFSPGSPLRPTCEAQPGAADTKRGVHKTRDVSRRCETARADAPGCRCPQCDAEEVPVMTTAIIGTGGGSVIARQLASGSETLRLSSADHESARTLAAQVGCAAVVAAGNDRDLDVAAVGHVTAMTAAAALGSVLFWQLHRRDIAACSCDHVRGAA